MLSAVVTLGLLSETDSACSPFMTSLRLILPLVANATTIMKSVRSLIQRQRFPLDIMLVCVRWYIAYALSLRNLEEMMQERGVFVDHSTIHRWVIKLVPVLEDAFRKRKRKRGVGAIGKSWRLDETYWKRRGEIEPQAATRN
jgi:transposase-like protein